MDKKYLPTTCTGVKQNLLSSDGNEMAVQWKSLIEHLCDKHQNCYHIQDLGTNVNSGSSQVEHTTEMYKII